MTTRANVVSRALSNNGVDDGHGYNCANPFSADLGRPQEAWCGDFATDMYYRSGLKLPVMQQGCAQGFAYVPAAWDFAYARSARRSSWSAQPGDFTIFDWNGDGTADHVELVEKWSGGVLWTVGGNSGPSNVDGFRGVGGVHRHVWSAPSGGGNAYILGAIDASRIVTFATAPAPTPAPTHPLLMLKTPNMRGYDIPQVQGALNHHGQSPALVTDGEYGPKTRDAVYAFQGRAHLYRDGVVGTNTRHALGLPA